MRKILSIIAIALMGAFVLSSCEKKYETEPLKTVNVSGEVTAWLDLTASEIQKAPSGTKLLFVINSEALTHNVGTYTDGYNDGYDDGYDDGYGNGYNNGYNDGYNSASSWKSTTNSDYVYSTLQYEAVVDSNGKYSIDLPAVNFKSVTYDIIPVEFVHNQKKNATETVERRYYASPTSVSVREGEVKYGIDIMYN